MSGGGGSSTTTTQASPEVRRLQEIATPYISSLLQAVPLPEFGMWQPRQIAGTNPFYESALGLTSSLAATTPAQEFLWGPSPSVFPGQAVPSAGSGPYGPPTGILEAPSRTPFPLTASAAPTSSLPSPASSPTGTTTQGSTAPTWGNLMVWDPQRNIFVVNPQSVG